MRKAFSLMELLIVILILGLLAGLVLPNLIGKGEEAKQKVTCIQMQTIAQGLKMFKLDNGNYPSTDEGLAALANNPDSEKYSNYSMNGYIDRSKIPQDPWNKEFIYVLSDEGFEIMSLGADGKEGGSKENGDILYTKCSR